MIRKKKDAPRRNFVEEKSRILTDKSDVSTAENYKSIRTNIMFSMPKTEGGKIITVASSQPSDGKTTTSINLAITFAQTGAKVILLDCDLRKARVHRYLELQRGEGISNILCGFTELDDAIKKDVRKNLDCLTAGEIPPNPAELLESNEFEKLLSTLKERYDYIFIDTPPIALVTDAVIVMKRSAGVVVVVHQGVTAYDMLDFAMDKIQQISVKLLGVIMVGCEGQHGSYAYYRRNKYVYQYKKGYRYGYRYRYEDTDPSGEQSSIDHD